MSPKSLLVADRDTIHRLGLAAVLRKESYTVATAADGAEAMERLQQELPTDLVLLDDRGATPCLAAAWAHHGAVVGLLALGCVDNYHKRKKAVFVYRTWSRKWLGFKCHSSCVPFFPLFLSSCWW
jgi:DNA-binding NarL/FixJ family response regulator